MYLEDMQDLMVRSYPKIYIFRSHPLGEQVERLKQAYGLLNGLLQG